MIRIITLELKRDEVTVMPGTIEVDGMVLVDNIFEEATVPYSYEVGAWEWDGKSSNVSIRTDLDIETLLEHLPDTIIYNEEGEPIGQTAPSLKETCRWAGWPPCFSGE